MSTQKTEQVNVRMRPEVKAAAEDVFDTLGLTPTQAITLFYRQVGLQRGLPFELKVPNEETLQAVEDARAGRETTHYASTSEMREKLGL